MSKDLSVLPFIMEAQGGVGRHPRHRHPQTAGPLRGPDIVTISVIYTYTYGSGKSIGELDVSLEKKIRKIRKTFAWGKN